MFPTAGFRSEPVLFVLLCEVRAIMKILFLDDNINRREFARHELRCVLDLKRKENARGFGNLR